MSILHIAVEVLLGLGAGSVLYGVYVAMVAYSEVVKQPKIPMFSCDRHGMFPAKYAIDLDVMDGAPVKTCPMCLELAYKTADAKLKAQEAARENSSGV